MPINYAFRFSHLPSDALKCVFHFLLTHAVIAFGQTSAFNYSQLSLSAVWDGMHEYYVRGRGDATQLDKLSTRPRYFEALFKRSRGLHIQELLTTDEWKCEKLNLVLGFIDRHCALLQLQRLTIDRIRASNRETKERQIPLWREALASLPVLDTLSILHLPLPPWESDCYKEMCTLAITIIPKTIVDLTLHVDKLAVFQAAHWRNFRKLKRLCLFGNGLNHFQQGEIMNIVDKWRRYDIRQAEAVAAAVAQRHAQQQPTPFARMHQLMSISLAFNRGDGVGGSQAVQQRMNANDYSQKSTVLMQMLWPEPVTRITDVQLWNYREGHWATLEELAGMFPSVERLAFGLTRDCVFYKRGRGKEDGGMKRKIADVLPRIRKFVRADEKGRVEFDYGGRGA